MSYPSQQFTPPFGQPPPNRSNHLWLIGAAVVVTLVVIMGVVLVLVQRGAVSDSGDGGGDGGGGEATSDAATTDDPGEESSDDLIEVPSDDTGDAEPVGFTESVCDMFDVSGFEAVIGEAVDPDESYVSATSSGSTGSLSCDFITDSYWDLSVRVRATDDAAYLLDYIEDDIEYWSEADGYEVSDYDHGDAGYFYTYGGDSYQLQNFKVAFGKLEITVDTWIDHAVHDQDDVHAMLQEVIEQARVLYSDYE